MHLQINNFKTVLWTLLAFSVRASAQASSNLSPVSGALTPGGGSIPAIEQIFEAAGRQPNATGSVLFNRTDYGTLGTWVWRVNITDIPIPNRFNDLGQPSENSSEGFHVVNTQWELQWPGNNGTFQSFLATTNSSVYVNAFQISLPSSVTRSYTNQTNGTCTALLGDQCTQSLVQLAARGDGIFDYSKLDGCASTLGIGHAIGGTIFQISPNSTQASNGTFLQPGGTLFSQTSTSFKTNNISLFREAESALNLLALDFRSQPRSRGTGSSGAPSVLCQVVNKTAASAATGLRQMSTAGLWSIVLIGTLFVI